MELDAVDGQVAVAHGHDLAVVRGRRHLQDVGSLERGKRVIPARLDCIGKSREEPTTVVPDGARLAVDELECGADLPAERLHDRLMPETDPERRRRRREPPDDLQRGAGIGRATRPRCDDEVRRREPRCALGVERVVSPHGHLRAELAEQVREVVRERVVVVDEEDHRCSDSARSIAASTPASLRRHSSCSAAGSESATIPAPAWRWAMSSRRTIVLIAMHVSSTPSSGSAYPTAPAYGPRRLPSSSEISCIARTFGAPETVPAGKQACSRSNGETPGRRSPATCETRCVTCEYRSTSRNFSTVTLPGTHTRERSLRPRSTSMTCSARSFSDPSRRAASPSPRSVVPAIGLTPARPTSHLTSVSGDEPIRARPSSSSRKRYGEGLTRRSAR